MVSWSLINTLALPVGIFLFRNGPAYYSSIRASLSSRAASIRSVPADASRGLNLLFITILVFLLYTLPYFYPANVFREARANLQTPTDVIFARIAALRTLTPIDIALKSKLTNKNTRLFYLAYGPDVVTTCTFCSASDPMSYLYYALPMILAPHLLHFAATGLATSPLLCGSEGSRWRGYTFWLGSIMLGAEVYWHLTYDVNANSQMTGLKDMNAFFWNMRQLRGLAFVFFDSCLAAVMWLASTNRMFVSPPTPSQRLHAVTNALDLVNYRLWATGAIRNTVARDRELRNDAAEYWSKEREFFETREVVDATASALERTDMVTLNRNAEQQAERMLFSLSN